MGTKLGWQFRMQIEISLQKISLQNFCKTFFIFTKEYLISIDSRDQKMHAPALSSHFLVICTEL